MEATELQLSHHGLKRWAVIQSWGQLISWLAWMGLALLLTKVLFVLIDVQVPGRIVFVGMVIGTLPSLWWTRPAEFRFRTANGRDAHQVLAQAAAAIGYISMMSEGAPTRYRQRLPHFMRWREAEIEVCPDGGDWLRVVGPDMSLRNLRRELLEEI